MSPGQIFVLCLCSLFVIMCIGVAWAPTHVTKYKSERRDSDENQSWEDRPNDRL